MWDTLAIAQATQPSVQDLQWSTGSVVAIVFCTINTAAIVAAWLLQNQRTSAQIEGLAITAKSIAEANASAVTNVRTDAMGLIDSVKRELEHDLDTQAERIKKVEDQVALHTNLSYRMEQVEKALGTTNQTIEDNQKVNQKAFEHTSTSINQFRILLALMAQKVGVSRDAIKMAAGGIDIPDDN